MELRIVAGVLQLGQTTDDIALFQALTTDQVQHHIEVGAGIAKTIDTGDRRHDDGIRALQQRLGGGESHLLDMLIDRGVLVDKGI